MAKANIPIYRDMVELLKLLMREVKNMPKADNRTLGDNIINRTLNCIYLKLISRHYATSRLTQDTQATC